LKSHSIIIETKTNHNGYREKRPAYSQKDQEKEESCPEEKELAQALI